jgi:Ni2+-binding GTPase involved in maturation of urease and hydrogenase
VGFEFHQSVGNVFGMAHRENLMNLLSSYLNSNEYRFLEKDYFMIAMSKQEVLKQLEDNIGKVYNVDILEFFLIGKDENVIINGTVNPGETSKSSVLRINYYGKSVDYIKDYFEEVRNIFEDMRNDENTIAVQWYYDNGKNIRYELIPEVFEDKIYKEAYPYINDIEKMIEDYILTPEPVLILMGKPGTGKTRLIRYIVKKMSLKYRMKIERNIDVDDDYDRDETWPKVAYATDSKILCKDQVFIDLLSGQTFALVLEDMDVNLTSRQDGNEMMNKMLSVSDGFLCNVKTKIIISTNIQNVSEIDAALLRPGRCFATINTKELNKTEAENLLKAMKVNDFQDLDKENYTLAEVYSIRNRKENFTNTIARRPGFNLTPGNKLRRLLEDPLGEDE